MSKAAIVPCQQDHVPFLRRKVVVAHRSIDVGQGRSDEAVEADFAARRARLNPTGSKGRRPQDRQWLPENVTKPDGQIPWG
jgi:hypothetical protein